MPTKQDIAAVEGVLEQWRQLGTDVHAYAATAPPHGKAARGAVIATVVGRLLIARGDHLFVREAGAVVHVPSLREAVWTKTSYSPHGTRVEIGHENSVYNLFDYLPGPISKDFAPLRRKRAPKVANRAGDSAGAPVARKRTVVSPVPQHARFATDLTAAGFDVRPYQGEQMFHGPCVAVVSEQAVSAAVSSTSVKLQSERTAGGYLVYPVANDDAYFDGAMIFYGDPNQVGILRPLTGRRSS